MLEKILLSFFENERIKYYSCLPIKDCTLLYPHKLPEFTRSVCFFLIPYFVRCSEKRNVSLYAVPRDYHLYVNELEKRLCKALAEKNAAAYVKVFADNSPFAERKCAERAGLGQRLKSGLLANPEYGTFFFIGSICLPDTISITQSAEKFKSDLCGNCEKCRKACPMLSGKCPECLSGITQKKKITDAEAVLISESTVKWGCDICQTVCPCNSSVSETPIEFFKAHRIPYVTGQLISGMTEEEFSERAYSWRGRAVITRNLEL